MMPLNHATPAFEKCNASHLKHLQLQGLQPKTVVAYARAIRTMGEHFDWQIDTLKTPLKGRKSQRPIAVAPASRTGRTAALAGPLNSIQV